MDIQNPKNHVFNTKLAKLIGLYQMVDPNTVKYRNRNIYHVVVSCVSLYTCLIPMLLMLSGLYYWMVNIPLSIDYIWKSVQTFHIIYKTWIIIHHSNVIWNCLSITRYDFTSLTHRNKHIILDRWRERLAWLTTTYATLYFMTLVTYLTFTLIFSEGTTPVKNQDGSIGYYRPNVMNFYLIISDHTYNAHYYMFYFIEALSFAFLSLYFITFDILLVILCCGMCCQMEIICSAFESVGHKSVLDPHSPIDYTDGSTKITPNEHDLIWDELKTIIMDHQLVMEKYKDFIYLFRKVMLLQIFISSLSVIVVWFTVIMSFSGDDRFKTSEDLVKKMFCAIPGLLFQIFMVCYLFGNVHEQKDSIIFALYSSNWTEMDMKCKKLILLTMKMNNANHEKLKFTRTKIVNLEMFFKTMGDCYTVISFLINYIDTENK